MNESNPAVSVTDEMVERAAKAVERATTATGYGWTDAQFEVWWNKDPLFVEQRNAWSWFSGTKKEKRIAETRIALTAALSASPVGGDGLPPLPNACYAGVFTPEQMHAYAREAIAAASPVGGDTHDVVKFLHSAIGYWRTRWPEGWSMDRSTFIDTLRFYTQKVEAALPAASPVGPVHALPGKWRGDSEWEKHGQVWDQGYRHGMETCADELEAALAAAPSAISTPSTGAASGGEGDASVLSQRVANLELLLARIFAAQRINERGEYAGWKISGRGSLNEVVEEARLYLDCPLMPSPCPHCIGDRWMKNGAPCPACNRSGRSGHAHSQPPGAEGKA